MYTKEIAYDRETRDYAMHLDGELVGFARNYHEAEIKLDQIVFELMSGQMFAGDQPAPEVAPAAEIALDALAFDLLTDEPNTDPLPGCDAMLCSNKTTHTLNDNGNIYYVCCKHYPDISGEPCDCKATVAFVPSTCVFCSKPHHPQSCPEMRAMLFAPDTVYAPSLSQAIALGLVGTTNPTCKLCGAPAFIWIDQEMFCQDWWQQGKCQSIIAPLDVDFVTVGWEV